MSASIPKIALAATVGIAIGIAGACAIDWIRWNRPNGIL